MEADGEDVLEVWRWRLRGGTSLARAISAESFSLPLLLSSKLAHPQAPAQEGGLRGTRVDSTYSIG